MSPVFAGRDTSDPAGLFARYLDLVPLGSRRRGVVVCPFHQDRRPSLSVDLDAGVFNCFGCGEQGGIKRFAELVGERQEMRPVVGSLESPLQQARRRVMNQERRRQARVGEWAPFLAGVRWLLVTERLIAAVRATASDNEAGWAALEDAATVERFVDAKSAELEALLSAGRVG